MAMPIVPRIRRGRLYFQFADAFFRSIPLTCAALAASAVHRLDTVELIDSGTVTPYLTPVAGGVE